MISASKLRSRKIFIAGRVIPTQACSTMIDASLSWWFKSWGAINLNFVLCSKLAAVKCLPIRIKSAVMYIYLLSNDVKCNHCCISSRSWGPCSKHFFNSNLAIQGPNNISSYCPCSNAQSLRYDKRISPFAVSLPGSSGPCPYLLAKSKRNGHFSTQRTQALDQNGQSHASSRPRSWSFQQVYCKMVPICSEDKKKRTSCHELSRIAAFQPTGCSTVAGYGWIIHDPGTRTPACKPLLHLKAMSSCIKRWPNHKFLAFYERFIGHCQQSLPYFSYFVIVVVMITEVIVLQPTPPVACFHRMILSAQGKMGRGRFWKGETWYRFVHRVQVDRRTPARSGRGERTLCIASV